MRYKILLPAVLLMAFASCQDTPAGDPDSTERRDGFTKELKTKKDSLYQDVMDGHDVGMAKMGKIGGYIKTIGASIDSLKKLPTAKPADIAIHESILKDLKQAEYRMNRWMEEFVLDSAENNEPVRISYLESEKDKVNRIRERILGSISRADSLYGK
jgi:hypothetical protein